MQWDTNHLAKAIRRMAYDPICFKLVGRFVFLTVAICTHVELLLSHGLQWRIGIRRRLSVRTLLRAIFAAPWWRSALPDLNMKLGQRHAVRPENTDFDDCCR
jgi:hypothetical protein